MTDVTTADNEVRNPRHEWYTLNWKTYGFEQVQCRQCGLIEPFPGSDGECVWRPATPSTPADAQRLEEIRQRYAKYKGVTGEDTEWLLAIIDRQNAVVEAARKLLYGCCRGESPDFLVLENVIRDLDAMSKTASD